MKTDWRMRALLGVVTLVSVGCQSSKDPTWRAIAATEDDLVVVDASFQATPRYLVSTDDGRTWTSDPSPRDLSSINYSTSTELCLRNSPQTCIRSDGARILESIDGGQTYETVWELDLRGEWLTRQLDTWGRAAISTGTMVQTDTEAVVVTVGDLAPVRRAPDGEWSPSEAQLRAFPIGGTLWAFAGIAILATALSSHRVRLSLAVLGSGLIWVGTLAMRYSSHDLTPLAYVLGILAATVALAYLMVRVINYLNDDAPQPHDATPRWAPARVAPWALPAVLLPMTMSAWAWDLMSWDFAEILWFGGIGISLVISLIQMRRQETQAKVGAQP